MNLVISFLSKVGILKGNQGKNSEGEFMWNVKKIKTAINNLSQKIKALKKAIRQPNVQISTEQHEALTNLKSMVTLLCVIRASSKGKLHLAAFHASCVSCRNQAKTDCEKCRGGVRYTVPMTLAAQNDWLNCELSPTIKAAYGDYVVKP